MRFLSLFSGIEAASVAWKPLGWECVGVAEIEAFPCAVLEQHYPDVPNLGDVQKITEEQVRALGHIDLVVGGFPCQDLSVAGKRAGFQGARSVLFFDAMRVVRWSRARWVVIENVPGIFSTHKGRDFAAVAGALAGCEFDVPVGGWRNSGVALGPDGLVEWCTLDAQFFGLAQRRKRVFLVRDSGAWADRPPVLLEPESLRGDPAPRREARQGPAAGTLRGTLGGSDVDHARASHLLAFGGNNTTGPIEVAAALMTQAGARNDFESETFIAGTVQASSGKRRHDEQATYVPVAGTLQSGGKAAGSVTQQDAESGLLVPVAFDTTQVTHPENRSNPQPGDPCHALAAGAKAPAIAFTQELADPLVTKESRTYTHEGENNFRTRNVMAFSCKDHGADATDDLAPTLRSMNEADGNANAGGQVAVAIDIRNGVASDGPAQTLQAAGLGSERGGNPNAIPHTFTGMQVRRLTPIECERLQGFRDRYTIVTFRRKPAKDGPRYKALGNSMATHVMRWIGERIAMAVRYELERRVA